MSTEELLWGCKYALSAIFLQRGIANQEEKEIPAYGAITVAMRQLVKIIEMHTEEKIDPEILIDWGREETIRLHYEMGGN